MSNSHYPQQAYEGAYTQTYDPFDPHSAETVAYNRPYDRPFTDPYRPAHETRWGYEDRTPYGSHEPYAGHEPHGDQRPHDAPAPYTARPPHTHRALHEAPTLVVARDPAPTLVDLTPLPPPADPAPLPRQDRRGTRRRRARTPERGDGSVRRLLPRALVVAFLAGGTTAFVAKDKAVELSVDGARPRTLHTFADDVAGLLEEEGVRVGPHDVVAPGPDAELTSGDEVVVHYARPVRLTLDGRRHEVWTTAHTVEGALRQLGVRAEGAYLSASRSLPIGRAGLALDVRTERTVTVMADGRARTIRTNAATVRDAVEEAGVTLRGQDTLSVAPDSFPREGQTVTVLRITSSRETHDEAIPYEVRRTPDPTLFQGAEVVEQTGRPGLRRVTYALRTVNGVRQRPHRIGSEVVRAPRAQVVKVGTKPLPVSPAGADGLNWKALAACESGGRPNAVDPSGTYGGLYQFDARTWHALGGKGRPQDAPAAEQTYRAKKLYTRRGAAPWPHCGARLHN
ncbi:ubiquitin-like domain-containing protein [Streptomyces thermocoprophilus]|uniref:Ubiquitin-like domain-containing protein n=1 Tax=Streptomyces thermocoprophilus TaxID=78356 RepID=A0ABV5VFM7_9ACTN